ncbi:extracellular solute-binding protein [Ferroacidibacillus organovorans]|uniref:ABC transporter substrate-binding protein n=1 Tax=Ferroacidibacillus organovorans TaxID=1765683 RepID=A0A101XR17_9BACL|nr:extracellular solute-binding protein [Ferroacidibacillus organovorans]KUO95947.1 ABC transporter substrate-binding protein [Ferroacidibacillus organovorans]
MKKKNANKWFGIAASGALLAGLVQVAPSFAATHKAAPRKAAPVIHLTLGQWSSSPAEHQLVLNQAALFMKENPGIDVSVRVVTGNYLQVMQPMLASHTAPDVFYVDSSYAPQLEASGVIMPLNHFIAQDHVAVKDFYPNLVKAFTYRGTIYGLPKDFNTLALESNPALLAKAGIKTPPATWAQFAVDAAKLKAKGIVPISFPIDVARYYPFIRDMGGSYYNTSRGLATFPNKNNFAGLNWFMQMNEKGYFVNPTLQGASWGGQVFAEGRAAMTAEGAWIVPSQQSTAPKMKYNITNFPTLNGHDSNMVYTVAYEMAKATKYPAAAAKLLFFMTGPQALAMTAKSGIAMPARKSQEPLFLKDWPSYKAFVNGVKDAYPYQFGLLGQNFVNAINNATQAGILKHQSAQTVLGNAASTLSSQSNY